MTNDTYILRSVTELQSCVKIVIKGEADEKRLTLPCFEVYESVGAVLSAERVDELIYRAEEYSAYKKGLELLAYGDNTKAKTVQKLRQKGYSVQIASSVAARLEENGYINEREHCLRRALSEGEKCYGKQYIAKKLYSLGFCRDDITNALDSLDGQLDMTRLLADYITRHALYDKLTCRERNMKNKAIAALLRRGFSFGEIKNALLLLDTDEIN